MRKILTGLVLGLFGLTPTQALLINFDYSYDTIGFYTTEAKATLANVSSLYENLISMRLDAIIPSGGNTWTMDFNNPSTGTPLTLSDQTVAENTILIFLGSQDLGGSQLGYGGHGGYSSFGSTNWNNNVAYRGNTDAQAGTAFSLWGGAISFNNTATWNLTLAPPTAGQNDFYSVAIHEIGHVLGFGSSTIWDDQISGTTFTGAASTTENGGVNPQLSPGLDHWASSINSPTVNGAVSQQTAFSPSITTGTRKDLTQLDLAGLQDLGWQVIPEPSALTLIGLGILVITYRKRTRNTKQDPFQMDNYLKK